MRQENDQQFCEQQSGSAEDEQHEQQSGSAEDEQQSLMSSGTEELMG